MKAIQRRFPGATGYSAQNLWRMRQFFETHKDKPKLSALLRELSWTHNLVVMGKCKRDEERERGHQCRVGAGKVHSAWASQHSAFLVDASAAGGLPSRFPVIINEALIETRPATTPVTQF
jgi:DUF1016 N-terminal domain